MRLVTFSLLLTLTACSGGGADADASREDSSMSDSSPADSSAGDASMGCYGGYIDVTNYVRATNDTCSGKGCTAVTEPTFLRSTVVSVDGELAIDYMMSTSRVLVTFYQDVSAFFTVGETVTLVVGPDVVTVHGETHRAIIASDGDPTRTLGIESGPVITQGTESCRQMPPPARRCDGGPAILTSYHLNVALEGAMTEVPAQTPTTVGDWLINGAAGALECVGASMGGGITANAVGPALPPDQVPTGP